MKALRWIALAALMASAACGDNDAPGGTDARTIDAQITDAQDIDAPPAATFTSVVIDLITNQTAGNTDSKPFAMFEALPDPDKDNPNAYEALFP